MELLFDFYEPDIKYSIKNVYLIERGVVKKDDRVLYLDTTNEIFPQYLLCLYAQNCSVVLKYLILLIVYDLRCRPINLVYLEIINGTIPIYMKMPLYFKRDARFMSYRCIPYQMGKYVLCKAINALLFMDGISTLRYST
jgi:hypothetical protein